MVGILGPGLFIEYYPDNSERQRKCCYCNESFNPHDPIIREWDNDLKRFIVMHLNCIRMSHPVHLQSFAGIEDVKAEDKQRLEQNLMSIPPTAPGYAHIKRKAQKKRKKGAPPNGALMIRGIKVPCSPHFFQLLKNPSILYDASVNLEDWLGDLWANELWALLVYNRQYTMNVHGRDAIAELLARYAQLGCPPMCPKCNRTPLEYRKIRGPDGAIVTGVACPGYADGQFLRECNYMSHEYEAIPLKVPSNELGIGAASLKNICRANYLLPPNPGYKKKSGNNLGNFKLIKNNNSNCINNVNNSNSNTINSNNNNDITTNTNTDTKDTNNNESTNNNSENNEANTLKLPQDLFDYLHEIEEWERLLL